MKPGVLASGFFYPARDAALALKSNLATAQHILCYCAYCAGGAEAILL